MSLASASGVSHTTVSAALRGKGNVSEGVRTKILKLARKEGYFPHAAAQMLRSKKSGYLGLVLDGEDPVQTAENGMASPILGAFLETCERSEQKYHVEFYRLHDDMLSAAPAQLGSSSVDGILVAGKMKGRLQSWLEEECSAPWIGLEEPAPHAFISDSEKGFDEAITYLYGLGHRHFGFFGWDLPYTLHAVSVRGYRATLRRLGVDDSKAHVSLIPNDVPGDVYASFLAEQAGKLLVPGKIPTAILCQGFNLARVVHLVLSEVGLKIPRDVSLIAYGPRSIAVQSYPRITYIEPDYSTMLTEALAKLKQLVAGESLPPKTVLIPTRLVHMESTGPAPS